MLFYTRLQHTTSVLAPRQQIEFFTTLYKVYALSQKEVKGTGEYHISGDDHVPYFSMCQKFKRIPEEPSKFGKCPRDWSPDARDAVPLASWRRVAAKWIMPRPARHEKPGPGEERTSEGPLNLLFDLTWFI